MKRLSLCGFLCMACVFGVIRGDSVVVPVGEVKIEYDVADPIYSMLRLALLGELSPEKLCERGVCSTGDLEKVVIVLEQERKNLEENGRSYFTPESIEAIKGWRDAAYKYTGFVVLLNWSVMGLATVERFDKRLLTLRGHERDLFKKLHSVKGKDVLEAVKDAQGYCDGERFNYAELARQGFLDPKDFQAYKEACAQSKSKCDFKVKMSFVAAAVGFVGVAAVCGLYSWYCSWKMKALITRVDIVKATVCAELEKRKASSDVSDPARCSCDSDGARSVVASAVNA